MMMSGNSKLMHFSPIFCPLFEFDLNIILKLCRSRRIAVGFTIGYRIKDRTHHEFRCIAHAPHTHVLPDYINAQTDKLTKTLYCLFTLIALRCGYVDSIAAALDDAFPTLYHSLNLHFTLRITRPYFISMSSVRLILNEFDHILYRLKLSLPLKYAPLSSRMDRIPCSNTYDAQCED
eukprot:889269_1